LSSRGLFVSSSALLDCLLVVLSCFSLVSLASSLSRHRLLVRSACLRSSFSFSVVTLSSSRVSFIFLSLPLSSSLFSLPPCFLLLLSSLFPLLSLLSSFFSFLFFSPCLSPSYFCSLLLLSPLPVFLLFPLSLPYFSLPLFKKKSKEQKQVDHPNLIFYFLYLSSFFFHSLLYFPRLSCPKSSLP